MLQVTESVNETRVGAIQSVVDFENLDRDEMMTTAEVAKAVRVSVPTVMAWHDKGVADRSGRLVLLPYIRIGTRKRLTHRQDLARFFAAINA